MAKNRIGFSSDFVLLNNKVGIGTTNPRATLDVNGNINISGITTITNASGTVTIGIGTTALLVEGNARVTGILTVGSASITLDGTNNRINVGTGLTLSSSGVNVTGVITATSFSGDGSNMTGVGIGSTGSINTTGSISAGAATFTSLNIPPQPITFSPAIGATGVSLGSNIIITFNVGVSTGTGNITLRQNSASGTAFSTIGVSSSSVTISGGAVTINPPADIGTGTTTFVVVDAGAFVSGFTTTSVNNIINTYSFTTVPLTLSSIVPANAATNVAISTNITLTFNAPPPRGTGTITLRSGSTSGTLLESFNVSTSSSITVSGNNFIINPTNDLPEDISIHTIIPSTAITGYVGLNTTGASTHSFTTAGPALGSSYQGGFLICKASPLRWVVSPYSAEVSRNWYVREDANTRAQQVSGCTGWFVPTTSQFQNPGFLCRSFWGPSPCYSFNYWTSTQVNLTEACDAYIVNGTLRLDCKTDSRCVRAFRCVTY